MRYMSTWEAMKVLYEGGKIRRSTWNKREYIRLNHKGVIVDDRGRICPIQLTRMYDDWIEIK